ncbi:MAG TPA: hypothetical protein VGZ73_29895 [Bryobacteraceae bacterium]|nr:hypothetical protein [Bryobacteraceae bacterium]
MEYTIAQGSTAGAVEFDFGSMPGKPDGLDPADGPCSAAHAEWLRRLRDMKLYKSHSGNWGEFCRKNVGLSGNQATEIIGILEEFGPAYFHLAELTPITPEEFRTVASKVKGRYLCVDGEAIALVPKNARRIAAAVEKLRRPAPARTRTRTRRASPPNNRVTLLEVRCKEVTAEFRKLSQPKAPDVDRLQLASVLRKTLTMLGRIEMELGIY